MIRTPICLKKGLLLFLLLTVSIQGSDNSLFQLVESIPVETNLGVAETARTLKVWLEMINSAQQSIDIEIFYLSHQPGEAFDSVLQALHHAANRGVKNRILTDAGMAKTYPKKLQELNKIPNISVRHIHHFNEQGGVMHAKYFMVDGQQIFLGSQNFDWRTLNHIHELGVQIKSAKLTAVVQKIFDLDWQIAGNPGIKFPLSLRALGNDLLINHENPLQMVESNSDTLEIYPTFSYPAVCYPGMSVDQERILHLIDIARERIEIQLLSYKPGSKNHFYETLDNALRKAAARGVKIKMILSNWNTSKPGIYHLKSLHVLPNIEISISSIPKWSGGFIPYARVEHCKFMLVDDENTWLGTSNWSWSYFHTSRNLGLVIKSKQVTTTVRKIFMKSWDSDYCQLLDPCAEYTPPDFAEEVAR
jgi:phosphatidylserine/phosphatidylglycerophosphate/cardiolipin synthase-like enzyme